MLSYILEVSLCWGAFCLFYWLLLSRETFFHFNRWYLLVTMILGLVIPLVEWHWLFVQPEAMTIYLQPITIGVQTLEVTVTAAATPTISVSDILRTIYFTGFLFFTIRLVIGVTQIARLYFQSERIKERHYQLVLTNKPHQPFSFFQLLFLSKNIPLDANDEAQILLHEQAHIRGWHSVDVVLIELLTATFWCSPFIYLYRRSLRTVHEYIADASVLRTTQRKQYGHLLIRQSQSGPALVIANPFHSQLKKRILMMLQPKSSRRHLAKYLLALPLLAVLIMAFAQKDDWTGEFPTAFTSILAGDYDEAKIRQELQKAMTENVDSTHVNSDGSTTFVRTGLQIDRCHEIYLRLIKEHPDRKADIQKLVKEVAATNGIEVIVKDDSTIRYEVDEPLTEATQPVIYEINEDAEEVKPKLEMSFKFPESSTNNIDASLHILSNRKIITQNPTYEIYYPNGKIEKFPAGTNIEAKISVGDIVRIDVIKQENLIKIWLKGSEEVDEIAQFPGCEEEPNAEARQKCSNDKLMRFLAENINYPKAAREQGIMGQVIGKITVNEEGKVVAVNVLKGIGKDCDEEVMRVLKLLPKWKPAMKNGKPVTADLTLPIQFELQTSDDSKEFIADTEIAFDTEKNQLNFSQAREVVVVGLKEKPKDKIYTFVDEQPEFPDGTAALMKWLGSNIKYPKESREKGIEGTTYIGFVIEKDGSISNVETKRGIENGKLLDEEAMRVVKMMPKWYPGKQDGKPVRVLFTLPLKFKLGYEAPPIPKAVETPSLKIGERSLVLASFKATPNPTSGLLNLSFKGEAKPTVISVYDLQGRELYGLNVPAFSGSFYQQIDLKQAPKGTLILSIRQGEKVFTEKIVLQ